MKIFAYGSNMSSRRLKERVPSASFYKIGRVIEHSIRFHKQSRDESGKADCYQATDLDSEVWGVIFDIDPSEKRALDNHEGKGNGYEEKTIEVICEDETVPALMYYATNISDGLTPYDWYLNHVIVGAKEFGLPEHYINNLSKQESTIDLDQDRRAPHDNLYS